MKRIHEQKIDTPEYYEKIWGDEYNQRPYYDAVRQRAFVEKVQHGYKVADLGAGVFGFVQYILEYTTLRVEAVCVDYSYTAKEIVNRLHPQLPFICRDVTDTGLQSDYYDVVGGGEIIEHIEIPAEFVAEMARICKPGGWMIISTVNTKCENAIKHGDYPEHIWEFEPEDLVALFEPYGETQYTTVGDYHFIYCRKAEA